MMIFQPGSISVVLLETADDPRGKEPRTQGGEKMKVRPVDVSKMYVLLAAIVAAFICVQVTADATEEKQQPLASDTQVKISGKMTSEGMFEASSGEQYSLEAKMAKEIQGITGERFMITGTVKEHGGKKVISVTEYKKWKQTEMEHPVKEPIIDY